MSTAFDAWDYKTSKMPMDFDNIEPLGEKVLSKRAVKQLCGSPHYILQCVGDGMSPAIKKGDDVLVEAIYPTPGEAGVIWVKGKPLTIMYVTHHYSTPLQNNGNCSPVVFLAQINPLKHFTMTGSKIDTLHRVVGIVRKNGSLRRICLFEKYSNPSQLRAAA